MSHDLNHKPRPTFANWEEAHMWMMAEVGDPCVDNFRYAWSDNGAECAAYDHLREKGCCGSFDELVTINGREARIGCNYGH